jgi:acyl CoA:acetate/3-ketoacid CoA transferase
VRHGGEADDAVRPHLRQIARGREQRRHQVAPLGAGRDAGLLDHGEHLVERRIEATAHQVDDVVVERRVQHALFHGAARRELVIAHDVRVRPVEQAVLVQELVEQALLFLVESGARGGVLMMISSC